MEFLNYIEILLLVVLLILLLRFSITPASYPVNWQKDLKDKKVPASLKRILRTYKDKQRFFIFWLQIKKIQKENIEGDFAELGVYKGESAKLLNLMAPERKLHLFDTFDGFKKSDLSLETGEAAYYSEANFADTSVETVKDKLENHKNLIFHPGYFPESAKDLQTEKFALVNMDVDLYQPTKAGLEFFYPKLAKGGVIIIHDYNPKWPKLMQAVDEFVKTIPENPVLCPDRDDSILIVKNT